MHPNVHNSNVHNSRTVEKEPTCPPTDEWIKKMWSIYTMENYTAIRKDEYPIFASTWTGVEEIILSEISQAGKSIIWFHLLVEHKE